MLVEQQKLVARAVFNALEFRPERTTAQTFTIAVGRSHGMFDGVVVTEQYIYEELAFVIETARQAQMLCGLVDTIGKRTVHQPDPKDYISSERTLSAICEIGPEIAQAVVLDLGIPVTKDIKAISELVDDRLKTYEYLFNECFRYHKKPLLKAAREMREAPRNHSILAYQRTVANYLSDSLVLEPEHLPGGVNVLPFTLGVGSRYDDLHRSLLAMCESQD